MCGHVKIASLWVSSALPSVDKQFYRDDHLLVDLLQQVVMLDSQTVALTPMEYRLLALLVQHYGEVVPRAILMQLWGYVPEMRTRTLDVHVRRLRKKQGIYADQYIETVHGVGYRFWPAVPPSD